MESKFNLNRPKISDEEINSKKDFDDLVKQFKQQSISKAKTDRSFLRNKKVTYTTVIAGVTVLCTVTYFTVFKKQPPQTTANDKITTQNIQSSQQNKSQAQGRYIQPVSAQMAKPSSVYKVNAGKGGQIHHAGNSKLSIPKKAFVNQQGEEITGEVQIEYREFHSPSEAIASGIPMRYDSAGTTYHFESAGMFEIQGYQNGEKIFIKPGEKITVEMGSQKPGDHFNAYRLDTNARNWQYLHKDVPQAASKEILAVPTTPELNDHVLPSSPVLVQLEKQKEVIPHKIDSVAQVKTHKLQALPNYTEPTQPKKPGDLAKFELDVDPKEFPELSGFKNMLFEIGPENKVDGEEISEVTWTDVKIAEGPDKGKNYLLSLKRGNRNEKLIVYPVLSGADYSQALSQYKKKFTEYKEKLEKREADELRIKQEFEAQQKAYVAEQQRLQDQIAAERERIRRDMKEQLETQYANMSNDQRVVRVFQVMDFGIYNSDCARSLPVGKTVTPSFIVNGQTLSNKPEKMYMIAYTSKMFYTLTADGLDRLSYTPGVEYALCIPANGTLYICPKAEFAKAVSSSEAQFRFTQIPGTVDDAADLRKHLGI